MTISVLTKRADFLAANRGLRVARHGFVLLARPNDAAGKRYGITVTKKIGNAVVRNRMKRRFRELLRAALPGEGLADHDHVLIGRDGGIERDFARLRAELSEALARLAAGKGDKPRKSRPPRGSGGDPGSKSGSGSNFGRGRGSGVAAEALGAGRSTSAPSAAAIIPDTPQAPA